MTLIKEYNLIENKRVIFWINIASIPLVLLFILLFTIYTTIFLGITDYSMSFAEGYFAGLFLFLTASFILIILHELIHGLFFKWFNPDGKVKFGFKNGMAYATSPNTFYSKSKFIIICLAPFVILTSSLMLLVSTTLIPSNFFVYIASLHAAACVGDFYWVLLLSRTTGDILVEDTEKGMSVYLKD